MRRESKFLFKCSCVPLFLCFLIQYFLRRKNNVNLAENPIDNNNNNNNNNNKINYDNIFFQTYKF